MHLSAVIASLLVLAAAGTANAGELTLYEFGNFAGRSLTATDAVSNFAPRGFNDRAASAVIRSGTWELCADADFRGRCVTLGPGRYPDLASMGLDRNLSSVREIGAAPDYGGGTGEAWGGGGNRGRVTLYEGVGFAGEPFVADSTQPNLHDQDFNDRARSLIVLAGQWEMCTDAYYRGACETFGPGRYRDLGRLAGQVSSLRQVALAPAVPPPQRLLPGDPLRGTGSHRPLVHAGQRDRRELRRHRIQRPRGVARHRGRLLDLLLGRATSAASAARSAPASTGACRGTSNAGSRRAAASMRTTRMRRIRTGRAERT